MAYITVDSALQEYPRTPLNIFLYKEVSRSVCLRYIWNNKIRCIYNTININVWHAYVRIQPLWCSGARGAPESLFLYTFEDDLLNITKAWIDHVQTHFSLRQIDQYITEYKWIHTDFD